LINFHGKEILIVKMYALINWEFVNPYCGDTQVNRKGYKNFNLSSKPLWGLSFGVELFC